MRYQGHGDRSVPNAPPGDLYIQIQIQEHPVFKRSGPHLHTELEIDAIEAMLGCTKELVCIDGQTLSIAVPEGAQPDTTLRLRERGMPMRHSGTPRGDCLVGLKIKVPTGLSDEHKAMLRDIASKRNA
jgi:molecular chaperone DnaJ